MHFHDHRSYVSAQWFDICEKLFNRYLAPEKRTTLSYGAVSQRFRSFPIFSPNGTSSFGGRHAAAKSPVGMWYSTFEQTVDYVHSGVIIARMNASRRIAQTENAEIAVLIKSNHSQLRTPKAVHDITSTRNPADKASVYRTKGCPTEWRNN